MSDLEYYMQWYRKDPQGYEDACGVPGPYRLQAHCPRCDQPIWVVCRNRLDGPRKWGTMRLFVCECGERWG